MLEFLWIFIGFSIIFQVNGCQEHWCLQYRSASEAKRKNEFTMHTSLRHGNVFVLISQFRLIQAFNFSALEFCLHSSQIAKFTRQLEICTNPK